MTNTESFSLEKLIKSIQPKSLTEIGLIQAFLYQEENRRRLYESRGEVDQAFGKMSEILIAKNDSKLLQELMLSIKSGEEPKTNEKLSIDKSGWTINDIQFETYAAKVDRSLALLGPIFLDYITKLSRVNEMQHIQVQASPQIQPTQYVQDKRGFFDSFRNWIDSLRPQIDKDYKKGMAIFSNALFDDFNAAKIKWEEYRAQHWQNKAAIISYDSSEFAAVLFDELEALDNVAMKVRRLNEAGTMLMALEQSNQVTSTANAIMQSASMAQVNPFMAGQQQNPQRLVFPQPPPPNGR